MAHDYDATAQSSVDGDTWAELFRLDKLTPELEIPRLALIAIYTAPDVRSLLAQNKVLAPRLPLIGQFQWNGEDLCTKKPVLLAGNDPAAQLWSRLVNALCVVYSFDTAPGDKLTVHVANQPLLLVVPEVQAEMRVWALPTGNAARKQQIQRR